MFRIKLRSIRAIWAGLTCLLILPAVFSLTAPAQNDDKAEKSSRKLVHRVDPEYPWDLKRSHIGGVVRMVVVVKPRGDVDSISVIGGNPVLVETATRAVKQWKYAPADSETTVRVNVQFDPTH